MAKINGMEIRRGSVIKNKNTGSKYQVMGVFNKSKTVHMLGFYPNGELYPQKKIEGRSFESIGKTMIIVK